MKYRIRRRRKAAHHSEPSQEGEPVQTKLEVGQPGDQYEKEADAVADKVVMMPNVQQGLLMKPALDAPAISMKCAECEKEDKMQMKSKDEEEKVQMKADDEEKVQTKSDEEEKVQAKMMVQREPNGKTYATNNFSTKLNATKGKGSDLPESVNHEFSTKIGADFSGVKVHTGGDAVQMSEDVGAHAFTHGKDIYFNEDKYNPATREGKHLLAHELTHVVQQTGPNTLQKKDKADIHDSVGGGSNSCACLVHIHNDERNSKAVAHLLQSKCGYGLVDVKDAASDTGDPRFLKDSVKILNNKGKTETKRDPNEIFSPEVIKTCGDPVAKDKLNKKGIDANIVCSIYQALKACSNDFQLPVVALHNNTLFKDPDKSKAATESTNIYKWALSEAIDKTVIEDPANPDRVVWTSNPADYEKLKKAGGVNTALQSKTFSGDTDLSTLFNFIPEIAAIENAGTISSMASSMASKIGLPDFLVEAILKRTFIAGKENSIRYVNIETEHEKNKYDQSLAEIDLQFVMHVLGELGLWCCDVDFDTLKKDLKAG